MSSKHIKIRRKRKPGRILLTALVSIAVLYGATKAGQGAARLWRLMSMVRTEHRALEDALDRIETLESEIQRLSSDMEYIEKIAREEYGMVKSGEEMFQISAPDTESKGR